MTIGTQKSCKLLVQSLYLTIRLWVVSRGETDVNVEVLAECGPNSGSELRATIRDNVLRESVETEYLFHKYLCCFKGCGEFIYGVWDGMPWRNDQLPSGWWYSSLSWGDQWQSLWLCVSMAVGGTGSGWRSPAWHWWEDLETLQMVHCWTKLMVSAWREGHQNQLERSWMVAVIPGWLALGELWTIA